MSSYVWHDLDDRMPPDLDDLPEDVATKIRRDQLDRSHEMQERYDFWCRVSTSRRASRTDRAAGEVVGRAETFPGE